VLKAMSARDGAYRGWWCLGGPSPGVVHGGWAGCRHCGPGIWQAAALDTVCGIGGERRILHAEGKPSSSAMVPMVGAVAALEQARWWPGLRDSADGFVFLRGRRIALDRGTETGGGGLARGREEELVARFNRCRRCGESSWRRVRVTSLPRRRKLHRNTAMVCRLPFDQSGGFGIHEADRRKQSLRRWSPAAGLGGFGSRPQCQLVAASRTTMKVCLLPLFAVYPGSCYVYLAPGDPAGWTTLAAGLRCDKSMRPWPAIGGVVGCGDRANRTRGGEGDDEAGVARFALRLPARW